MEIRTETATGLDIIEFLNKWAKEANPETYPSKRFRGVRDLWWVLSGTLRGPDSGEPELKRNTTAILRRVIFPEFTEKAMAAVMSDPKATLKDIRVPDVLSHFSAHITLAAEAYQRLKEGY